MTNARSARAPHISARAPRAMRATTTLRARAIDASANRRSSASTRAKPRDIRRHSSSASDASSSTSKDRARKAPATNGGAARSFVGASFYADPYDTKGAAARGMPSARELSQNVRNLSGPMSGAARRAKGAMRPGNGGRGARNRADDVIERRRKIEREMKSQMVEKEVESLVKKRVRARSDEGEATDERFKSYASEDEGLTMRCDERSRCAGSPSVRR